MTEGIIISLIGLGGSMIGSIIGIIASSKLTLYRIEQLEKKQDMHNSLIERVFKLEQHNAVQDEEIKFIKERI